MNSIIDRFKKLFWRKIRGLDLIQKSKSYDILVMDFLNEIPNKPFNNQKKRIEIIRSIFKTTLFDQVIETGSFLGATSRFLASIAPDNSPVFSIELDKLFYAFNKKHSKPFTNLAFINSSSEKVLKDYQNYNISLDLCTFFYLDAHWEDYLPLRDELKSIQKFETFLIVIDDFKVEGNSGFYFDKYGLFNQKKLEYAYIKDLLKDYDIYFPNYLPSEDNLPSKPSGSIFITNSKDISIQLSKMDSLKKYNG